MIRFDKETTCKHCNKKFIGKAKIIGLTLICPFCGKPAEQDNLGG